MGNPLLDTRVTGNILRRARLYSDQVLKRSPLISCIYIPFLGAFAKL